jgi:hypothetical protein
MGNEENDEFLVEFDGPGVNPDSLDTRRALEVAASYVDLVQAIALKENKAFTLQGLQVRNKCGALAARPSDAGLAQRSAQKANQYVSAGIEAPDGLQGKVKRVRRAVSDLPVNHVAKVIVGPWANLLKVETVEPPAFSNDATISLRAVPLSVGGKTKTKATLRSGSEEREFVLVITVDQAKQLGKFLYEPLDIVAKVRRADDGSIKEGHLLEIHPLEGSRAAWKDWYKSSAEEWDSVEDLEKELGRNGD